MEKSTQITDHRSKIQIRWTATLAASLILVACTDAPRTARGGGGGNNNSAADAGNNGQNSQDANSNMNMQADAGFAPADAGFAPADTGPPPPMGLPVLGNGEHISTSVVIDVVADVNDGINRPTDVAFHPDRQNEMWVINQGDSTFWIGSNVGQSNMSSQSPRGRGANLHFLSKPSAIAFGAMGCSASATAERCFATSHGNHNDQPGVTGGAPEDFMGPTLWTANVSEYSDYHTAHYDMLHNSPYGMGIAWERDNIYWIYDGHHESITRYDFHGTHGGGGTVHDDGEISRWVQGFVKMESGVPSHMKFDHSAGLLYIADTGNNRIAVLNPSSGARSSNYGPDYDGITRSGGGMYYMQAQLTTFLDGQAAGLSQPSGLALHDNKVFVSDYDSGRIYAFDMEGNMIDYLDPGRGRGSVVGMAFDSAGNLFVADLNNEQILKISPKQ